jgi:hypothetical protein
MVSGIYVGAPRRFPTGRHVGRVNLSRHSGAVRSTEPGIQPSYEEIWIPGSGLRPAPE